MFTNTYRKCWFADVILFGVTVCSKFYTKCIITLHNGCNTACDWKSQRTLKTVTANVISITGKEYIMYISKHDGNSCWLLKTVVSTVSGNLMQNVHNLYGKVYDVWPPMATKLVRYVLQGSVDTLVRWGGQLNCLAMSNYVRNIGVVRYCGQRSCLLRTPALRPLCRSNAPAQGEEGIGRCVLCMCELCRVEEGLSRREQLVRYF